MFCKNAMRIFFLSVLIYASCVNPTAESASDSGVDEDTPVPEITGHKPKNPKARYLASAQGETEGKLIEGTVVRFAFIVEFDSSKQMLNQTRWNNSMKIVEHFDTQGDLIKLETFDSGIPSVYQENVYNERDNLKREFRVEHTSKGPDTTLYEYHYLYAADGLSYVAFRTNNGDTVTRFTWEKQLNRIYKTEEAYPYRGFTIITKQEITTNEVGKPVTLSVTRISSEREKEPLDTTVSTSRYFYNNTGQLIEERNENDIWKAAHIRYRYRNGMIGEMVVDGKPILYEHFAIAKSE